MQTQLIRSPAEHLSTDLTISLTDEMTNSPVDTLLARRRPDDGTDRRQRSSRHTKRDGDIGRSGRRYIEIDRLSGSRRRLLRRIYKPKH